ncbi:hypothetical protein QJQ45_002428 [Haematococcus lacustris]|nr:hypothetical protein QJQ45_002428 [Haematococcus lacustris]
MMLHTAEILWVFRASGFYDERLEINFWDPEALLPKLPASSEPGPSTPPPAKRSKRTKAEQAAEPTQPTKGKGKAQGTAAKAKPAPQPGRWRPLELCWWQEQKALPAKGKEYPGLGYKRLRDKPPKAQQQQQPAVAQ